MSVKIPKQKERPFAVPAAEVDKENWYKEFNKRNIKFIKDKNLQLLLEGIEKNLMAKILKR